MISNPRPNEPIDKTPSKGEGRPKRTPKKTKFLKELKELKMDVQNVPLIVTDNQRNRNVPLGLKNNSNVCLFNSVVQVLFSQPSF